MVAFWSLLDQWALTHINSTDYRLQLCKGKCIATVQTVLSISRVKNEEMETEMTEVIIEDGKEEIAIWKRISYNPLFLFPLWFW